MNCLVLGVAVLNKASQCSAVGMDFAARLAFSGIEYAKLHSSLGPFSIHRMRRQDEMGAPVSTE